MALGLAGIVAVGGAFWWSREHKVKASPSEHGAAPSSEASSEANQTAVRVEVVHPQKGGITRTSAQTGSVFAFEEAALFAKVSGYLEKLSVDIGDRVKQGQVLAVIEDPELIKESERAAAAVTQAKAAVTQAEARVKTSEANLKAAEAVVEKSKADIERYTSTRRYREKELARYRGLFEKQAVPKQIVDEEEEHYESAIAAEHSAQAEVVSAKAQVVSSQAMIDQARADLAEAKANVEVADANLAKAKVLVDYTKIISPYDGVVTARGFHRGAFIKTAESGTELPILHVARTDRVRVVTYVPDRDVPYTNLGDKALIELDALPGKVFEGKVSRFAETEDVESRTMRTEIDMENPDNELREGMYGIATLILNESPENLNIPASCLTGKAEHGKASVYVIQDGKAHLTKVAIGADDGLHVEILSGLTPESQVVLNTGLVFENARVEPVLTNTTASPAGTSE